MGIDKKANKFEQIICRHTFLTSIILVSIISLLFWVLNGFRITYASYDDYPFTVFLNNNNDIFLFLGAFLSKFLFVFQKAIPTVNVYPVFLIIVGFISFTTINYVLVKRFSNRFGLFFSIVFDLLFINSGIINLQYTQVSGITCLASAALFICLAKYESRKRYRVIQVILGIVLAVIGSQLRFDPLIACYYMFLVFIICNFIYYFCRCNEKSFLRKLRLGIKKSIAIFLLFIMAFGICYLLNFASNNLKNGAGFEKHLEFNQARTSIQDYWVSGYEGNEEFYNSVSVYSNEDLLLLTCFKTDKDMYSVEKMNAIADYSYNHDSGKQNIYLAYFASFRNKVKNLFGNEVFTYPILALGLCILTLVICVVYKIREKIKPIFILLFFAIWIVFCYLVYNRHNIVSDVLLVSLFVVSLIIVLIGNRFQYINVIIINLSVIVLAIYMIFTRMPFRAEYTFCVPAIFYLFLMFESNDIRKSVLRLCEKSPKHTVKCVVCFFAGVLIVYVQYFSGAFWFNYVDSKYDSELVDYVNSNSKAVFFYDYYGCELLDHAYKDPFALPDSPQNTIQYGGWLMGSFLYDNQLKMHKIDCLYKEMINNNNAFFVISKKDKSYAEMLESYYNSHYKVNKSIVLNEVYSTQGAWIYNVKETKD